MKKTYWRLVGFFFLLIMIFAFARRVEAIMYVPYFNVLLTINSAGGDADFNYNFSANSPGNPLANDNRDFDVVTENGTADYRTGTMVSGGDYVYILQQPLPGWRLINVSCLSADPNVQSESFSNDNGERGVRIIANPFSSISCTFNNIKAKTPVIIIPGIASSYLNDNDEAKTEIWPNIAEALFGWPGDHYLDKLSLNEIGQSDSTIIPTDIFRKIGNNDFFDGLIKNLEANGYEENKDLFVFPYDWRLDIRAVNLKEKVDQVLQKTGAEKVNIVAHSMGGLLAKYYIEHEGTSTVDKFIDIATPHLGAPSAFKTLMYGDDMGIKFGFFGLNSDEVKKISQNMPSVYQLLPSENYFSLSSPDYKYYIYDMDDIDHDGTKGRLSYDQSLQLLKNMGRNDVLLDNETKIHNDLDIMNPADYSVRAYNIVGCGVPTVDKYFTLGQKQGDGEYYDVGYISGDGTVPEKSARSFPSLAEYHVSGISHPYLSSSPEVRTLVNNILKDQAPMVSTSTDCQLPDGDLFSFHGPVQVDLYDQNNNHTGPVLGSGFVQNIDGVYYDVMGSNIFAYLPLVTEAKIKIAPISTTTNSGTNRARRFNLSVKKVRSGQIVESQNYIQVLLPTATSTAAIDTINLDLIADSQPVSPSATISGDSSADQTPPVTTVDIVGSATGTTVTFMSSSTDIAITIYSTDGGENYNLATSTIIITDIGTTTITYQAIDNAGNIEELQQIQVYVPPPPLDETISTSTAATTTTTLTDIAAPISSEPTSTEVVSTTTVTTDSPPVSRSSGGGGGRVALISTSTIASTSDLVSLPSVIARYSEAIQTKPPPLDDSVLLLKQGGEPSGEQENPTSTINTNYASVLSAKPTDSKVQWLILIFIILVTSLFFISRKLVKKVE